MKVVLFGVGKGESRYIREWTDYHIKIGFDNIYIYDNEDKPTYKNLLKDFKNVIVKHIPGSNNKYGLQTIIISHFQNNYIKNYDYCVHLDLDEFLCLKKHNNIKDFINDYFDTKTSAIGINWVFFGSNNLDNYENKLVLERFTKCQKGSNQHIKLIVDVKKLIHYIGPHKIKSIENTFTYDTNKKLIEGPFNLDGPIDISQINHYKVKSKDEFRLIIKRPRPDKPIGAIDRYRDNFQEQFSLYDLNDIEDLHALYFYLFS